MSKQYGLIIPGQEKKASLIPSAVEVSRPSIFNESSDSDDGPPLLKMKSAPTMPGVMERRMARRVQEKALKEDPTVYQYDELYEEMENKREEEKQIKSKDPKKPKYIGRLMEYAERRKLENELRVERQVQKEREQEGEEFKDKESFVTSAYRKKLEEMRLLEEKEKHDEYLESIGDVTKQKDLDGFYRHIFEQKTGTTKEVQKPELPNSSTDDVEIAYKPIKSGKPQQQRAYRKRHSDNDEDEEAPQTLIPDVKKVHLQNNIDADSDFSIDSSSDDEDKDTATVNKIKEIKTELPGKETDKNVALKLDILKKEKEEDDAGKESNDTTQINIEVTKPKMDKSLVWKKRTIGEVYEEAVKRYYQRKASRNA